MGGKSMSTATLGQAKHLLTLFDGVPAEQLTALYESGLLSDLSKADVAKVDRDEFRRVIGLGILLESIGLVIIPATTEPFVAKDKFVVNTKRNATVKISAVWDNFTSWFLSGAGKTEDPIGEQTLRYHKLRKSSVDGPIITELGGEVKVETTLSEMFSLMEKQKHGEDGVLLNNGYANIFYIRDQNGVLRAVCVDWVGDGWYVRAGSVERPGGWSGGNRVFSRNSVLESSGTSVPAKA